MAASMSVAEPEYPTDPQPGEVYYSVVNYDGGIFPRNTLVELHIPMPDAVPEPGAACLFDDGEEIVIGRLISVGDWWTVDEAGGNIRRRLLRSCWILRAIITVQRPQ